MFKSGAINRSLYPFSPRAIEIDYISPPKQKTVFIDAQLVAGVSASICNPCDTLYPHDSRNLSINEFLTTYLQTIKGDVMATIGGELMQPIGQ